MSAEVENLIDILEVSVKRNGDILLTNKHLLNILKILDRRLKVEDDDPLIGMSNGIIE